MPSYKLYYFNVRGRAEFIRYMFLHGDIPFEDFRIDSASVPGQWDALKPSKHQTSSFLLQSIRLLVFCYAFLVSVATRRFGKTN
jgi:hypothetical protein